jgi:hypothetical protein
MQRRVLKPLGFEAYFLFLHEVGRGSKVQAVKASERQKPKRGTAFKSRQLGLKRTDSQEEERFEAGATHFVSRFKTQGTLGDRETFFETWKGSL